MKYQSLMLVLFTLGNSAVSAEERTNPVPVMTRSVLPNVELALDLHKLEGARSVASATTRSTAPMAPAELQVGTLAEVCFRANATGYVTLWSDDPATNRAVLIYPNAFSHPEGASGGVGVAADTKVCVGGDEQFRLRVAGVPGKREAVYLHWTPVSATQLGPADFPAIGRDPASQPTAAYASTSIEYILVDP